MKVEKKLDKYIDALNNETQPREHIYGTDNDEFNRLTGIVKKVKALKNIEYPDIQYEKELINVLIKSPNYKSNFNIIESNRHRNIKLIKRSIAITATVAAAALLLFTMTDTFSPRNNSSIVYAMEKAIEAMKAYHGIIEYTETNQLGETMTQSGKEVWADKQGNYYVKELKGFSEGTITVNNGQMKWQLRPEDKNAYIYQTFPDPYRFTFELDSELDDVKNALTVREIGEETISGRETIILEITPDAGEPYHLWIDKENKLPLQRESAMQNALSYKVSYSFIEFVKEIPDALMNYILPEGFKEVNNNSEQIVGSLEEAEEITGIQTLIPDNIPEGYMLDKITAVKDLPAIKLYYNKEDNFSASNNNKSDAPNTTVVISQSKAIGELKPDMRAILGDINGSKAEIIINGVMFSIRWQQQGMEYSVLGNDNQEIITTFTQSIANGDVSIPTKDTTIMSKPKIEVPVDMTVEENEQKSVDAGHSPWRLDPAFVTQVFASLLLSPEGIVGDYPIPYEAITITENSGVVAKAVIKDENSIARTVYLKRLVRQDETGIWTVIGYDIGEN